MIRLRESEAMKIKTLIGLATIAMMLGLRADAQTYDTNNEVVQTFAGSAFSGYLDGQGQLTMFNNPNAIVADSHSNLFVWDSNNYLVRKIAPNGTVTTFAGGGNQATGIGTNVNLGSSGGIWQVIGLAIGPNDTLIAPRTSQSGIGGSGFLIITSDGIVTTNLLLSGILTLTGLCADSMGTFTFRRLISSRFSNTLPMEF